MQEQKPFINPEWFARFYRKVEPRILLLFEERAYRSVARSGKVERERRIMNARYRKIKGARAAVALVGIGAPATAVATDVLIALGAKELVFFGSAGSIVPELSIGDVCVCTKAFPDDGTSRAYVPDASFFAASERLTADLKRALDTTKEIAVFSTDAFFMETPDKVERFRRTGACGVEMEAAAVFAIAQRRGVEAAGVLVISDRIHEKGWTAGFWDPRFIVAVRSARKKLLAWLESA